MFFTVPGEPVGKGRPKFSTFNGHAVAYTPQKTVNYENLVKLSYQQQCADMVPYPKDIMLRAQIHAYFAIPKSASKKKAADMRAMGIMPTKKPDIDNIIKSILDALNGIAFYDDSQVVGVQCYKFYSDNPRVDISIEEV